LLGLDAIDSVDERKRWSRQAGDETAFVEDAVRLTERLGRFAGGEGENVLAVEQRRRAGSRKRPE